jgi:hypothetical protein
MKYFLSLVKAVFSIVSVLALSAGCFLWAQAAFSMPPYQEYSEQHSGRTTNCAMCHVSDMGPTGEGPGQMGSMSPEELAQVRKAEAAMQPGSDIQNPLLNKFGNHIVHKIGMLKFLQLTTDPGKLPEAIGFDSDLDGDGIPDAQEFLDGTNPLDKYHGDPQKLFFINLNRCKFDIVIAAIAVFLLEFGLRNLIRSATIASTAQEPGSSSDSGSSSGPESDSISPKE